jgi:hypothetical protein
MLDFYFIKDSDNAEDHSMHQADFAGGLKPAQFRLLQKLEYFQPQYKFNKDFRLYSEDIREGFMLMQKTATQIMDYPLKTKNAISPWYKMLRRALEEKCGLIAFAD